MAEFTENNIAPGLTNVPRKEWPTISPAEEAVPLIDRLVPNSVLHTNLLKHLLDQIRLSEGEMNRFYPRWQVNERKVQAYVDLENWEKVLKEDNNRGAPPKVVKIIVPYTFATIATIVTYLVHTFTGRKPMFQIGTHKRETVHGARMMEIVLQYNADHARLIRHLFQFFQDGELYGVGILKTKWKEKRAMRTVWRDQAAKIFGFLPTGNTNKVKVREERLIYSGNEVSSIDPFLFFPDPRVPMNEVNRRGEFVYWRAFEGTHTLKAMEAAGELKWINNIGTLSATMNTGNTAGNSARSMLSGGTASPGDSTRTQYAGKNFNQIDQGSVFVIPRELGLGSSTVPTRYLFTIANKKQIIQAEPLELDHDMHPICVSEPYTLGYGFGQLGVSDYLGPTQDTMSWFINSHIDNVRTALNNMFVVDENRIVIGDLKKPEPGKIIRLKKSAAGTDVRTALQQLQVADVTGSHIRDMELFMRMGDTLSAINDNLKGVQDSGGRKTATEVRTSGEAAASRLASHAKLISAQAIVDLTEQMSCNIQQFMDDEFYIDLVGSKGMEDVLRPMMQGQGGVGISPEMLVGDFHYPVHDGTLPLDRVAMLDSWREVFSLVAGDPQLRSQFNVGAIFEFMAELSGIKNIDEFKMEINPMDNNTILQGLQAGNFVGAGQ